MRRFRHYIPRTLVVTAAAMLLAACASSGETEKTGKRGYYGSTTGSIMSVYR